MSDPASFFKISPKSDVKNKNLILLNTDIWTETVVAVSGYTLEMLKQPLFESCMFIRNNLSPDRLAGFDLKSVLEISNFSGACTLEE